MELSLNWKLIFYVAWLFVAWTFYVEYVYLAFAVTQLLTRTFTQELFRISIFVLPLMLIFKKWIPLDELSAQVPNFSALRLGLFVAVAWVTVSLVIAFIGLNKQYQKLPDIHFWLTGFSVATVIEEIVFRGYLAKQMACYGKTAAIILSSVLFVLIHYPGWCLLGTHTTIQGFASVSISIFLLGVVLGGVFFKTNSIWPCVIVHAGNNLAAALATNSG